MPICYILRCIICFFTECINGKIVPIMSYLLPNNQFLNSAFSISIFIKHYHISKIFFKLLIGNKKLKNHCHPKCNGNNKWNDSI